MCYLIVMNQDRCNVENWMVPLDIDDFKITDTKKLVGELEKHLVLIASFYLLKGYIQFNEKRKEITRSLDLK